MGQPFSIQTPNNLTLHGKVWGVKSPKYVVSLVHGMGEHIGRYDNLVAFLNERDIAVVAIDREGHGKSDGKRGHVTSFNALMWEVKQSLTKAADQFPGVPQILYGHSMGGNLVLNYFFRKNPDILGVVATSPWIRLALQPPKVLVGFAGLVNKVYPQLTLGSDLNAQYISTIPEEVERYLNDPLVHSRISTNTFFEMSKAAEWLDKYEGTVTLPLLLCHGNNDGIVDFNGTKNLSKRLKGNVVFKEWDGMAHELQHDKVEKEFFEFIYQWISNTL